MCRRLCAWVGGRRFPGNVKITMAPPSSAGYRNAPASSAELVRLPRRTRIGAAGQLTTGIAVAAAASISSPASASADALPGQLHNC